MAYPDVGLKAAREKRDASRKQHAYGLDPAEARKAEKLAQAGAESFEAIVREWHMKFSKVWNQEYSDRVLRRFENDFLPWLGKRPIAKIEPPELLAVLRRIESRGAFETAHRARQNCDQIYSYAMATGRVHSNSYGHVTHARPKESSRHPLDSNRQLTDYEKQELASPYGGTRKPQKKKGS